VLPHWPHKSQNQKTLHTQFAGPSHGRSHAAHAHTHQLPPLTARHPGAPPPSPPYCGSPSLQDPGPPGPRQSEPVHVAHTHPRALPTHMSHGARATRHPHAHPIYMLWHLPHTSPMPTRSLPVADPSSLRDDESSERERRRQGRPMLKACTRHTHGGHTVVEPCAYHVHTPRVRSIEASALLYHVSQGRVEASGHCRAATVTPQASHA